MQYSPISNSWQSEEEAICPRSQTQSVILKADAKADLNWENAQEEADQAIASGKKILWQLDLGLSDLPLLDDVSLAALRLNVQHFASTIWPKYKTQTLMLSFAQLQGPVEPFFWNPHHEQTFTQWHKQGFFKEFDREFAKVVYKADVLSDACQFLASTLDEQCLAGICWDMSGLSLKEQLILGSRARFEYLVLGLSNTLPFLGDFDTSPQPLETAFCLPSDAQLIPEALDHLVASMEELSKLEKTFRIIPETALTQQWHALENLYVSEKMLSPNLKRMLLGFEAAGGQIHLI